MAFYCRANRDPVNRKSNPLDKNRLEMCRRYGCGHGTPCSMIESDDPDDA